MSLLHCRGSVSSPPPIALDALGFLRYFPQPISGKPARRLAACDANEPFNLALCTRTLRRIENMARLIRTVGTALLVATTGLPLFAQTDPKPVSVPVPIETVNAKTVAVTVNGQAIYEPAVERALQGVAADERAKARGEVINFIVENTIIDQYLVALKVEVEAKDIAAQLANFKEEVKKNSQDYETLLIKMKLTESELKDQIINQLRWEKFVNQQTTDEKLKALFAHMPEAFDGTTIRARHILIPFGADEKSKQEAAAKLTAIKADIEKSVADGLSKLQPNADNLTRQKLRNLLMDEAFSEAARKNSTCPTKEEGGDLNWFPRYGRMVEPFAKAAFALQKHQMSELVQTQFGYHLIMVTDRKAGMPTKFEDPKVKDAVKEVYEMRLREAVLAQMKPRAKIEMPTPRN